MNLSAVERKELKRPKADSDAPKKRGPVRVLNLIPTLARGGAERQLVNLVQNAAPDAVQHIVCYFHAPDDYAGAISAVSTVHCLNLPFRWPWLYAPIKLLKILEREKPDIVQTWLMDADLAGRLALLLRPGPLLVNTLHSTTYDNETIRVSGWSPRKMAGYRLLEKLTIRLANPYFVAVSNTAKESAQRNLGIQACDIRVIYNSIDERTLRCDSGARDRIRDELRLPSNALVFINVSRIRKEKGLFVLIAAFALVYATCPTAFLVLVGDGPDRENLRRVANELGVFDRVRFTGTREDIGALLEAADVFVFPSLSEGLGLAPIEAMMKGLPVIASRIGALQEIVADGESGFLVAPGSVEEFANSMLNLYRNERQRSQLGSAGRLVSSLKFGNDARMREWQRLYKELLHA
jgi:glycosyltransferase involved in cell wall biosynthesis